LKINQKKNEFSKIQTFLAMTSHSAAI